jgi:hypothetical protein
VTFTPTDATHYNTVTGSVNVTVNKVTPSVTAWPAASAITYGQTLASSTLSGGAASVPGTFAFTNPATAPKVGTNPQSVTFTPTDATDYNTVTGSVNVTVLIIVVTSPIGGESCTAGGKYLIKWNYMGNPGRNVKIQLLEAGSVVSTIASSTSIGKAGAGSYSWTIPKTEASGNDYQIKVRSTTISSYSDTSNAFTISGPTISVTSPASAATWTAGRKYAITWNYTGNPGPVRIDLLNNGSKVSTITPGKPVGSKGVGSYSWTVPKKLPSGTEYTVQITSTANRLIYDVSSTFTITRITASAGPDQR